MIRSSIEIKLLVVVVVGMRRMKIGRVVSVLRIRMIRMGVGGAAVVVRPAVIISHDDLDR